MHAVSLFSFWRSLVMCVPHEKVNLNMDMTGFQGKIREPLVWRQENPVFHSSCKLELGIALQSLQGKIDLIYTCVQDLTLLSRGDRDLGFAFQTHPGSQFSPRG